VHVLSRLLVAATTDSTDPFGSVKNFFKSSTWHFAVLMFWFFLVVVWLACAYWVYKDARRRIDDRVVIIVAVLTGLVFGPFGLFVYAILRPPEYLEDTRERELELRMLEQRLDGDLRCPFCKTAVKDDYLVCPHCMRRLREVCSSCHRPVEPGWRICPYCEKQIPQGQAVGLEIG
jgi:RNA polymerase subunit RPABC4/transcription elongation factor Spt4